MIDWRKEELLSLREAAALLGKPVSALNRWARVGLRGVRLEVLRVGHLCTSVEALQRFFEATTPPQSPAQPALAERSRSQQRASAKLREYLQTPTRRK